MDGRARAGAHRVGGAVAVVVAVGSGGGVASLFHGLNSVSGEKGRTNEGPKEGATLTVEYKEEERGRRKEGAVAPTTVK